MQIRKHIVTGLLLMIGSVMLHVGYAQSAATQSNPVKLLEYIADNMIDGLKSNKASLKNKPQIVYNLAYKYVVPYADIAEMSKRVIPPQVWNGASATQRSQFQKEFTRTLIRTYASALTAYRDQTVQFYPVRGGFEGKNTVEVRSQITSSSSQPINVSYRMVRSGSVWRLYDMSVEGVDMLSSFRSQFASILSQGNMDLLLSRMSSHNSR